MRIQHLRNIIKLKRFVNRKWVVAALVAGVLLVVLAREQPTGEESFEFLRELSFGVVFMVSFGLMYNVMVVLLNLKQKEKLKPDKSQSTRIAYVIGFVALVVLIVLTDFSVITFWSVALGLFCGVLYSLFSLIEKGLVQLLKMLKGKIMQRQFDKFTKRK